MSAPAHAGRIHHLKCKPWYRVLGEPDFTFDRVAGTPSGFVGLTLTPGDRSVNQFDYGGITSPAARVEVTVYNGAPTFNQVDTMAHELYGHALPYILGLRWTHPWVTPLTNLIEVKGR